MRPSLSLDKTILTSDAVQAVHPEWLENGCYSPQCSNCQLCNCMATEPIYWRSYFDDTGNRVCRNCAVLSQVKPVEKIRHNYETVDNPSEQNIGLEFVCSVCQCEQLLIPETIACTQEFEVDGTTFKYRPEVTFTVEIDVDCQWKTVVQINQGWSWHKRRLILFEATGILDTKLILTPDGAPLLFEGNSPMPNKLHVSWQKDIPGAHPIHWSAGHGLLKPMLAWLASGVDIELVSDRFYTPLMYACRNGRTEIIRALIDHGVDVNHSEKGHVVPTKYDARWRPSKTGERHNIPLLLLLYYQPLWMNVTLDALKLLLENGVNVDCIDESGETPLSIVIKRSGQAPVLSEIRSLIFNYNFICKMNDK